MLPSGSTLNMTGGSQQLGRDLTSAGVTHYTGGQFGLSGDATFTNESGGVFNAVDTSGIVSYGGAGTKTFVNAGTFNAQPAGGGTFAVTGAADFVNTGTGTVNVDQGTLRFQRGIDNGGTVAVDAGAEVELDSSSTYAAGSSLGGAGTIEFGGGTHDLPAGTFSPTGPVEFRSGTVTVNNAISPAGLVDIRNTTVFTTNQTFADLALSGTLGGSGDVTVAGTLSWTGGRMEGGGTTVLPSGSTLNMTGGSQQLGRDLTSAGVTHYTGGQFGLSGDATFTNESGGVFNAVDTSGIVSYGGAGTKTFVNAGTFNAQPAGGGTFAVTGAADFVNTGTGTVNVDQGTLRLSGPTNIGSGGFLSSGIYRIADGATLDLPNNTTTITADVEIDGTGSVQDLADLDVNRGRIALTGGADLAITPASGTFTNEGILDLSPTSDVTVTGDMTFAGASQPVVRSEIASASDFGTLAVSGTLSLDTPDSTSRFDPDLAGGYDPALGERFEVITAGTITGAFDSFQGGEDPSGDVLLLDNTAAGVLAVEVGPGPLPPPPQVVSTAFDFETRQAIVFTFDQDVSAFLTRSDYTLVNTTTGQAIDNDAGVLTYNAASNEATLLLTGELPDGNYELTIAAGDIANAAGVPASGSPIVFDFFVLAGDANRDRAVTIADFALLRAGFGGAGVFSDGDFNYDGQVTIADFAILRSNFGTALPRPAAGLFADGEGDWPLA